MTSTFVTAASHQIPPIHLSQLPRVRPPRLLPGTPSPNTNPQPPGPVPDGEVWVQGKWRNQASNAAKHHQHIINRRVTRALKHHNHGKSIFAYRHVKTNQVVYSLTRNMERSNHAAARISWQKTVPAALRRDSWRPYFAVHFPETEAGARAGLTTYLRLRRLAMRRQLYPPEGYLVATEEDQSRSKNKAGAPTDVREKLRKGDLKLPVVGQRLPKKLRAEKLMNQRATSVADLAFTLTLATRNLPIWEEAVKLTLEQRDAEKRKRLGQRGRKKLREIRAEQAQELEKISERQALIESIDYKQGKMPIDAKVADNLSIEYDGVVAESNRVINKADINGSNDSIRPSFKDIQVLWADIRDGTYAKKWSEGVFHGELQPLVTSRHTEMRVRQPATVDDDGVMIEKQLGPVSFVSGSSPHVIGREKDSSYRPYQDLLQAESEQTRPRREAEADKLQAAREHRDLVTARQRHSRSANAFEKLISNAKFTDLAQKEAIGEYLSPPERQVLSDFRSRQRILLVTLEPLRRLEAKYPELTVQADLQEYWEMQYLPSETHALEMRRLRDLRQELTLQQRAAASQMNTLKAKTRRVQDSVAKLSETGTMPSAWKDEVRGQLENAERMLEATKIKLHQTATEYINELQRWLQQTEGSRQASGRLNQATATEAVAKATASDTLATRNRMSSLERRLTSLEEMNSVLRSDVELMQKISSPEKAALMSARETVKAEMEKTRQEIVSREQEHRVTYLEQRLHSLQRENSQLSMDLELLQKAPTSGKDALDAILQDVNILRSEVEQLGTTAQSLQEKAFHASIEISPAIQDFRSDYRRLQSALDNRKEKIQILRIRAEQQKGEAVAGAKNAARIAGQDTGTHEAAVDAAEPMASRAEEMTMIDQDLSDLYSAQERDAAELRRIQEKAFRTFVEENPSLDIDLVLPKTYRDPKYWNDTDEANQRREEVPRIEDIADEEEKRALQRESPREYVGGSRGDEESDSDRTGSV